MSLSNTLDETGAKFNIIGSKTKLLTCEELLPLVVVACLVFCSRPRRYAKLTTLFAAKGGFSAALCTTGLAMAGVSGRSPQSLMYQP
jgi:hypothetical protein